VWAGTLFLPPEDNVDPADRPWRPDADKVLYVRVHPHAHTRISVQSSCVCVCVCARARVRVRVLYNVYIHMYLCVYQEVALAQMLADEEDSDEVLQNHARSGSHA
jgi:hypothetical protein